MEKLIVKPNDVRCLGDIVSPKSLSDFEVGYNSLTKGSDTVDGASSTVYISDYMAQCHFEISNGSRFIPYTGQDSFEVTTGLYLFSAWTHGSISDATVKCYLDDVLIGTGTTDSNGNVSFTIPISERTVYPVKFVYDGGRVSLVEESCRCSLKVNYVVAEDTGLTLIGEENIIQSGDTDNLLATLTGTGITGEKIGIPYQTIEFYRYNPLLFFFEGCNGFEVDSFVYNSSEVSMSIESAGTTITGLTGSDKWVSANLTGTSSAVLDYFSVCTVEFDVIAYTGTVRFVMSDGVNLFNKLITVSDVHVQVVYDGEKIYWNVDGVTDTNPTLITFPGNYSIRFNINTGATLQFKNFIIGGF